jgi:predicted Zn-dependent protease
VKPMTRPLSVLFILLGVIGCSSMGGSLLGTVMDVAGDPNKRAAVQQTVEAVQTASQEITPEQEYYIGRAVAANILATRKAYSEQKATDYINVLGRSLTLYSDRPETFGGYHFLIMDSGEINAFAAPGGLILISRGLLRCADTEETVAAILAHEISHVVLKHGLKAISNARWTAAVQAGANATVQVAGSPELKQLTGTFKDSINDITNTLVNSGYSREQELQADQMALVIMRKAGYDPQAFDEMLTVMKSKLKPGGTDFAKTHPDPKVRIAAVEKTLQGQPAVTPASSAEGARQARYRAALGAI